MGVINDALIWLNDPLNWTIRGGILDRLQEHIWISVVAVLAACVISWPLGVWLGHTDRGGGFLVGLSNLTRAIPIIALLTIFPLTVIGFGERPIIIALTIFAIPPLLANAYLGVRQVDNGVREAAKGMGLSGWQVLSKVELPLSVPYLASGFRIAAVQVLATATLASFVNGGGLGMIISRGFGLGLASGGDQILAGGILVAVLCLVADGLLALVQRWITPKPLRQKIVVA
jgi:osmoprotectant transport system permease protein